MTFASTIRGRLIKKIMAKHDFFQRAASRVFAIHFLAFCCACSGPTKGNENGATTPSPVATLTVQDALTARAMVKAAYDLKDPDSAKFRNIFISAKGWPKAGNRTVCGEINSKNSYGAYVGFIPFIYSESNFNQDSATNLLVKDPSKFNSQILIPQTKTDFKYFPDLFAETCKK